MVIDTLTIINKKLHIEEIVWSYTNWPCSQELYGAADKSFKFVVDGFGRKYDNAERIEIMKRFASLPLRGSPLLFTF